MRQTLLLSVLFVGLTASAWGETIINEAAPQSSPTIAAN